MSEPQTPQAFTLRRTSLGPILGVGTSRTTRLGDFQMLLPVTAFPVCFSKSLTTYPGFGCHLASSMSARIGASLSLFRVRGYRDDYGHAPSGRVCIVTY